MATTFILEPDDYSAITFNVIRPEGSEGGYTQSNYNVLLPSIALGEEARIQFEYAQYQHREGGEVRDTRYPLVPITFTARVVGLGATTDVRKEDLLEQCSDLMRAVYNSNGYLKYKPDGLGATVLDTYYRYVQSVPPRPLMGDKEYWGRSRMAGGDTTYVEGYPSRQFEVTLMTQPIAMSDPDNPYEVLSATTLKNIGDGGAEDNLTIVAATVKGSVPATTRIIAHPLTAGADAAIGTLWIAKRTSGLGSFVSTYLTATHQAPAGVWSTVADASRCGNAYYRCTPAANNTVYATRYTISNWASHKGRAAILIVARNNGVEVVDFDVYYRWAIANYPLTGKKKQLSQVKSWEPLLLGEIDLPETEMSSQEELDLYVDICVERTAGSGTFDIDGIKLLYTDEAAIQADMPAGEGALTTHSFLLENFDEEIAHAIVHATDKLAYICNPYGDFITLEPDVDNRLDVAWARYTVLVFEDDFSKYADYWLKIGDFESDETWDDGSAQTDYYVEGEQSLGENTASLSAFLYPSSALDLSSWSNTGSFVCFYFRTSALCGAGVTFYTDGSLYWSYFKTDAAAGAGEHFYEWKISDFIRNLGGDWGKIESVQIRASWALARDYRFDDLRLSSADPYDSNKHNDTGGIWEFPTGHWHIYELDGVAKTLGQIDIDSGVEKIALIYTDYGTDVKYRAKVRAKRDDGKVGIVFRCSDGTGGSEDCYAFLLDTDNDEVLLRSYVAGASSNVAAAVAYICDKDTDYYLGVIVNGTSIQCFVSPSRATLWDVGNREFNATDSDQASGRCGLMTIDTLGRFTDVKLEAFKDLHIPGDTIQLSAYSLFRTIYPFHEDAP